MPNSLAGYEILELLGRGGMGIVYKARQQNPDRLVALKVIRSDLASEEMLKRFQIETATLGRLQHPGIARIYEAGTAMVDGYQQPFFAMEFIEGMPLQQWMAETALDDAAVLALMVRICDAVQHAHQQGVIHRDLKPDNIMVDEHGCPRILDFGLARSTDADIAVTRANTTAGQILGTLPYMAPEQAAGQQDAIDTRCDVYALGVITYELLAGRLPLSFNKAMVHEAIRIIQEEEPERLSTFNRSSRGDLETIVRKAMEKEKGQRYESVSALAADLDRFLKNEPISARSPGTLYQISKFARRNRVLVVGVAGIFASLIIGVIGTSIGMYRAGQAQREAETQAVLLEKSLTRESEALDGEQQQRKKAEAAEEEARLAAEEANRFYGGALYESAIRSFSNGEPHAGKVLLAKAAELKPDLDPRAVQLMHIVHPDFPIKPFLGANGKPIGAVPVAISGDGRFLFYVQDRRTIIRHCLADGTEQKLPAPLITVFRVIASTSGKYVAACDNLGNILLYDAEKNQLLKRHILPHIDDGEMGLSIVRMDFHPDETELAVYWEEASTKEIHYFDTNDLSLRGTSKGATEEGRTRLYDVAYAFEQSRISFGRGPYAYWITRDTAFDFTKEVGIPREVQPVTQMDDFYGDFETMFVTGCGGRVRCFSPKTLQEFWAVSVVKSFFTQLEIVANGYYVIYGGAEGIGGVIDRNTGKVIHRFDYGDEMAISDSAQLVIADGMMIDTSWLYGRKRLKSHSDARELLYQRNLDRASPHLQKAIVDHRGEEATRTGLEMYTRWDAAKLECVHVDTRFYVADATDQSVRTFPSQYTQAHFLVFIEDGRKIFMIGYRGSHGVAEIVDLETGEINLVEVPYVPNDGLGATVTLDRKYLVLAEARNILSLYDIPALNRIGSIFGPQDLPQQIYTDPETGKLVVGQRRIYSTWFDLSPLSLPPLSYAEQQSRLGMKVEKGKAVAIY